ncbi:UNVERIFIED_CONTAM: hypothetical protein Scaly_1677800 [Sesamum calycinum]|uniref:Reverse transcriptase n=1 Tax=Sesamum calycinum TaxID=2727403 RepID=A0AAW2NTC6_9LAMI
MLPNINNEGRPPISESIFCCISETREPISYNEATPNPKWVHAMNQELDALEANDMRTLTNLPLGKKTIGAKWVFKLKYKADGTLEQHKTRLVAKEYTKLEATKNRHLFQLDVNNAFLHGDLHEEVYTEIPQGYMKAKPHQGMANHCASACYHLMSPLDNHADKAMVCDHAEGGVA